MSDEKQDAERGEWLHALSHIHEGEHAELEFARTWADSVEVDYDEGPCAIGFKKGCTTYWYLIDDIGWDADDPRSELLTLALRERDEARRLESNAAREVERLQKLEASFNADWAGLRAEHAQAIAERDEARAECERLRDCSRVRCHRESCTENHRPPDRRGVVRRCRHENAEHVKAGDSFPENDAFRSYVALVEQFRCLDCGAWLSLGPARDDGPHAAQVAVELRAAELAAAWKPEGGVSHIITPGESIGWHLWPHEEPTTPAREAGWLASQIQNHRMDGHNIAGAEYAAKLVATTHEEE